MPANAVKANDSQFKGPYLTLRDNVGPRPGLGLSRGNLLFLITEGEFANPDYDLIREHILAYPPDAWEIMLEQCYGSSSSDIMRAYMDFKRFDSPFKYDRDVFPGKWLPNGPQSQKNSISRWKKACRDIAMKQHSDACSDPRWDVLRAHIFASPEPFIDFICSGAKSNTARAEFDYYMNDFLAGLTIPGYTEPTPKKRVRDLETKIKSKRKTKTMKPSESTSQTVVSEPTTSELYIIHELLESKLIAGKVYILVSWEGYTSEWDTWEPRNELLVDVPDMVSEFDQRLEIEQTPVEEGNEEVAKDEPMIIDWIEDDEGVFWPKYEEE